MVSRRTLKQFVMGICVLCYFLVPQVAYADRVEPSSRGERIAERAVEYVGVPYVWGGNSPDGWDCSGFSWYVYREEGISIPRYIPSLAEYLQVEPAPGDILIFRDTYRPGLSHVGISLGGDKFVHAAAPQWGTIVSSLSNAYWAQHFVGAYRPW